MLIIGIAGGTGSGKTTVVNKIIEALPEGSVAVIPQDSYYNDQSDLPLEVRKQTNFDHPNAFDWTLLSHQIEELKAGRAIEQPTYSYITCTRLSETIHVEPKDIIIVEGIMSLYDKNLRDQMDLKIFVDTGAAERLLRVIVPTRNACQQIPQCAQAHARRVYRTHQAVCRHHHPQRRRQRASNPDVAQVHHRSAARTRGGEAPAE